jgi:transposase
MYLLQPPLFSFEQILELQPKNRLQAVFATLNLGPALQLLKPESKFGPKGYSREAMLRSLIAKQLEAIPNIAKLVERLRTDPSFRYHCGFNAFGTVPSEATFSRFIAKLEKTGAMDLLFEQVVTQGRSDGVIGSEYVALDSTEISAWEKPQPNDKPTSDQEAA